MGCRHAQACNDDDDADPWLSVPCSLQAHAQLQPSCITYPAAGKLHGKAAKICRGSHEIAGLLYRRAYLARPTGRTQPSRGFGAPSASPGVYLDSGSPINTQDSRAHIRHMFLCRGLYESSSANNTNECRAHVAPSLLWSPCQTT